MSAGQTGQMTGQMGHVHGTDGTQTRGRPAKILDVYWFFFFNWILTLTHTQTHTHTQTRTLTLVAHDCGYPLSRYTCRATRVAADFLDFRAFGRCSTGVALHPLKILVSHLPPPRVPGGVTPKFGSEKVSRYTGVSQLHLHSAALHCATKTLTKTDSHEGGGSYS